MNARAPSLRGRLARHVIVPLVATWALGTGAMVAVAQHFAAQAFDRSLLDDALALASRVIVQDGRPAVALTEQEIRTLLFDHSEAMYFAVRAGDGALIAGHAGLGAPASGTAQEFGSGLLEGSPLRTVSLHRDEPVRFTVVVGQTTASRTALLHRMLLLSALPQALLIVLLAVWLRRRIRLDLQPLGLLEQAIARRDGADLASLPPEVSAAAGTRDVERIARAIDSLFERLRESAAAQREFAGTVAHELRTPLAGIRAQAAFALADPSPSVWREQLAGIAQAEQRASRMVDQLLALARAAEGAAGLQIERIDLADVARDVLLRSMARAQAAGVDLGGEGLEDGPVPVHADRALVEGILHNLIDNAMRYGANAAPSITVAVHHRDGHVELTVTDNGPGLPPAEAKRLHSRWAQGEAGRDLGEGAGLGLGIVARYADLLGAQLSLDRGPGGRGLCARLVFGTARQSIG